VRLGRPVPSSSALRTIGIGAALAVPLSSVRRVAHGRGSGRWRRVEQIAEFEVFAESIAHDQAQGDPAAADIEDQCRRRVDEISAGIGRRAGGIRAEPDSRCGVPFVSYV